MLDKIYTNWVNLKPSKKWFSGVVLSILLFAISLSGNIHQFIQLEIARNELKTIQKENKLSFNFKLEDEFPTYASKTKDNGQWIWIPYTFYNSNDYDVYYRISWLLFVEVPEGQFIPAAHQFAYNYQDIKATKKLPSSGKIETLLGKPVIDHIKNNKRPIEIVITVDVWDKQDSFPFKNEKPDKQEIYKYRGVYLEDGSFIWREVPSERIEISIGKDGYIQTK